MAADAKYEMTFPEMLKQGHTVDAITSAVRQAYTECMLKWKEGTLPRHFEEGAESRYRYTHAYTPVNRGYLARKRKVKRHVKPMVWSGQFMRTLTTGHGVIEARGAGRSMRVVLKLPWARVANLWSGGVRKHDFHAATTCMTNIEMNAIEEYISERVAQLLNENMASRTTRTEG